jgi:hypothetical protein
VALAASRGSAHRTLSPQPDKGECIELRKPPLATVEAANDCAGSGPCPEPCQWGRQAIDDVERDGWPDAELIARACEYLALDVEIQRLNQMDDLPDDFFNPIIDRGNAVLDAVTDLPAKTEAGWKAKAAVLGTAIRADICHPEREHVLAISLSCDLTGDDIERYLPARDFE